VIRIHNAIDPNIFSFQDHKKPIISFMTRKNTNDILQVINILKFRYALDDYKIVPIEGKTEKEVAQILNDTMIFLSFGYQEGFYLPAAEAMACGCVVIGYHGMGGREFFKPEFSFPITNGDIILFAQTLEKVIDSNKSNKNILKEKGKMAAEFIAKKYSIEQQEKDVTQFWGKIVKSFSTLKKNEDNLDQSC
jgi:glycosyltransferase involved in cell wall biosynthesis